MTASTTRPARAGADPFIKPSTRRRRISALVVLGLLVLAIAAAVGWTSLHAMWRSASGAVGPGTAGSGYAPGGSVFDEQVPATGRAVTVFGPGSPYAPGGSVFDEQVPAAGRTVTVFGPGSRYASGWSVYDEQVPCADRFGTS